MDEVSPYTPLQLLLFAHETKIRAKFGDDPCCYMFLDPDRYEREQHVCIRVDDDEAALVRAAWLPSWRDREMDCAPKDGRICVIRSMV